ncbi:oligoendopeptidase F [Rubrivivax gelatinosus]|uniref:Oligopeptidase F n=1 Tax=Rubrivivax gelatinosus TaxID=28068 RepID=A0A4R2MT65_RUBGE|nr:oligoendopeptidase F [Rubrivivax gelatinosus]TCP02673.1 oligoendopeptidase F [Rubrivivax gelatinosus]
MHTFVAGAVCAAAVSMAATAMAAKPASRVRAEIPAQYRWDFSPIYANWDAWEAGMREMDQRIDAFARLQGTLKNGPDAVLAAYRAYDEIGQLQYRIYRYPQLQRDTDTRDQNVAGRFQRVGALFAKFDAASAWFTPELLTVPEATMREWLDKTPALKPYRFPILENFRRQAHVLDEKGERLMALASRSNRAPNAIYSELSTSDIKFPTIRLSDGKELTLSPANYQALLSDSTVQADRAAAAAAHVGTYGQTAHTYAAIYEGILQRDWFVARARNFPTTLDAALDENAIPRQVVETLIEVARQGTGPLQRYARLRQRLLGLPSYHLYDQFVPVFRSDKTWPYDEARRQATASIAPLGQGYVQRYEKAIAPGRVDVYENEGKRSGAYNAGVYGVGPYMLLNYNDTRDAMFTFAHEAGHAMHTVLSTEHQPYATADYTIFVAEVASTTNERFLLEHLLKQTTDPKERFLLLQEAVDAIVGTFYTQVLFADFELRAHQLVERDEPVTTEVLNKLYAGLLKEYWGDAITHDEFYQYTWARIPHFFNSPYYVYQYATCFASSAQLFKTMTEGPKAGREAAVKRYLELLSSGGNDQPMKQLQKAGVDLTQRQTVQAVVDQLDELVTRMEAEAAKLQSTAK